MKSWLQDNYISIIKIPNIVNITKTIIDIQIDEDITDVVTISIGSIKKTLE